MDGEDLGLLQGPVAKRSLLQQADGVLAGRDLVRQGALEVADADGGADDRPQLAGIAWLGLVVGGALAVNTVVAVSIGGTVPLVLRRLGKDPALASGPILTTITDLCGFLLALSFASALLSRLVA